MRNESVAEGIKRRTAENAADRRRRMHWAVQIAVWGGAIGFTITMVAVAVTTWGR